MESLCSELKAIVGEGALLAGNDVTARVAAWGTSECNQSPLLVRPKTTAEVAAVMRCCHARDQSVVVQGGVTGLARGALNTAADIILSTECMNSIEGIDSIGGTLTAQAGVILQMAQEAAREKGWMFPVDLGAKGSAQLGGMVSTNAGGNRVMRYGMMRDNVLGIEAVLANGDIVSSMSELIKNNTGYDLKQLFIGSEGTLGVVTKVVVRLHALPSNQQVCLLGLNRFSDVIQLYRELSRDFGSILSAFEVLGRDYYQCSARALGVKPLPFDSNYYVLLECLGSDDLMDTTYFENVVARQLTLTSDAVIATNQQQRDQLWAIRENVECLSRFSPFYAFDVSVPLIHMPAYIDTLKESLKAQNPIKDFLFFGHLGDGNLHIIVAVENDGCETKALAERSVYGCVMDFHGSISAEHGIGLEKKHCLSYCRSDVELIMMRGLKSWLDPKGILNPGKVI